ncbi:MAG TPA: response regulator [Candidatus Microsaccharimonas sp.]|nr:response regulator [Candidatus Microsaccharimonas sp.]
MAKVLLVEDDNNLREIYEARLQAEGYETATASDGEQALVVAKETKPDLVISDVMMPKISGFEMLDILRNTDGMKDVKVIMLTALGQSEDKTRADQLGADKYLVKSQVTLEDIVKTAHQLLDDSATPAVAVATPAPVEPTSVVAPAAPTTVTAPTPEATVAAATSTDEESAAMQAQIDSFATAPAVDPPVANPTATPPTDDVPVTPPASEPVAPAAVTTPEVAPAAPVTPAPVADDNATGAHDDQVMATAVDSLTNSTAPQKPSDVTAVEVTPPASEPVAPAAVTTPEVAPAAPVTPAPVADDATDADGVTIAHKKIIQPLSDPANAKPDINQLLAQEQAAATANDPVPTASAATTVEPTPETPAPSPAAAGIVEPTADPNAPHPDDIAL